MPPHAYALSGTCRGRVRARLCPGRIRIIPNMSGANNLKKSKHNKPNPRRSLFFFFWQGCPGAGRVPNVSGVGRVQDVSGRTLGNPGYVRGQLWNWSIVSQEVVRGKQDIGGNIATKPKNAKKCNIHNDDDDEDSQKERKLRDVDVSNFGVWRCLT